MEPHHRHDPKVENHSSEGQIWPLQLNDGYSPRITLVTYLLTTEGWRAEWSLGLHNIHEQ